MVCANEVGFIMILVPQQTEQIIQVNDSVIIADDKPFRPWIATLPKHKTLWYLRALAATAHHCCTLDLCHVRFLSPAPYSAITFS